MEDLLYDNLFPGGFEMNNTIILMVRILLGTTGLGTMIAGGTAPIDAIWIKVFTVLCGIITIIISVTFTTLIMHIASHSKEADKYRKVVEEDIDRQAELCELKFENKFSKLEQMLKMIHDKICSFDGEDNG